MKALMLLVAILVSHTTFAQMDRDDDIKVFRAFDCTAKLKTKTGKEISFTGTMEDRHVVTVVGTRVFETQNAKLSLESKKPNLTIVAISYSEDHDPQNLRDIAATKENNATLGYIALVTGGKYTCDSTAAGCFASSHWGEDQKWAHVRKYNFSVGTGKGVALAGLLTCTVTRDDSQKN